MYRRAAICALVLQAALRPGPQPQRPDATLKPIVLKSTSRAVQLDVFVTDPSGRSLHGLQKSDFVVADNGYPRDIRIFAGEIDPNETTPIPATTHPLPGMYSNRLSMSDSRIVTAIVIDAAPRPEGLQKNAGVFASSRPQLSFGLMLWRAIRAINRMAPGQTIAIYAACPDLRIVQDYTSDPGRLIASLSAFVPPPLPKAPRKKQPQTIDTLVPPMLSALRNAAARMSGAGGRKSVVWISQGYGTELNLAAISDATDATIDAFNAARTPLYAVEPRFSPTCQAPAYFSSGIPEPGKIEHSEIVALTCSQPLDVSDEWMRYLANATGGRAFSGGNVSGIQGRDPPGPMGRGGEWGAYQLQVGDGGLIGDALRFAVENSRYGYVIGFYVPEAEIDGKVHTLSVTLPTKPDLQLRYRREYSASIGAAAAPEAQAGLNSRPQPGSPRSPDHVDGDQVGIDAKMDRAAKDELQVSLALAPETVTRTADGVILLDATFTQSDTFGKQLAKVHDVVRASAPETPTEMVPYSRAMKLIDGAAILHIAIRDQATNRTGMIAIPIGKP